MDLSEMQIEQTYDLIKKYHAQYLEESGVKLPALLRSDGNYTKDALVLVYLAQGYPNTRVVSKSELTEFIQLYYPETNDVQQARHLAAQKGWYIVSGTRNDNISIDERVPSGCYKLVTLEKFYPGFTHERRANNFTDDYWENLKMEYDYRCACCGCREGEKHRYWKNRIVRLQKGHMNPSKPLEEGNIIPQCDSCNQADRNNWIYDRKGRVVGIANETVIDSCPDALKKKIYKRLYSIYKDINPSDL